MRKELLKMSGHGGGFPWQPERGQHGALGQVEEARDRPVRSVVWKEGPLASPGRVSASILRTWEQPRTLTGMSQVASAQDWELRVPRCPGWVGEQPRRAQKEWTRHGDVEGRGGCALEAATQGHLARWSLKQPRPSAVLVQSGGDIQGAERRGWGACGAPEGAHGSAVLQIREPVRQGEWHATGVRRGWAPGRG